MIENMLITVLIIAISMVLLCISLIVKKHGRFPNTHVGGNKAMRDRGIHCVMDQDREARSVRQNRIREKV